MLTEWVSVEELVDGAWLHVCKCSIDTADYIVGNMRKRGVAGRITRNGSVK